MTFLSNVRRRREPGRGRLSSQQMTTKGESSRRSALEGVKAGLLFGRAESASAADHRGAIKGPGTRSEWRLTASAASDSPPNSGGGGERRPISSGLRTGRNGRVTGRKRVIRGAPSRVKRDLGGVGKKVSADSEASGEWAMAASSVSGLSKITRVGGAVCESPAVARWSKIFEFSLVGVEAFGYILRSMGVTIHTFSGS